MRPTAASANKSHDKHDKTEVKSPPRPSKTTAAPSKPKPNGQAKKPAPGTATGVPTKPSSRPSTAKSAGSEKASSLLSSADAAPAAAEQTNGSHEFTPAPEPQQAAKPILSHEPSAAAVAATESRPVEHQNHQQPQQSGLETPPTGLSNGAAASSLPQEQEQEQEKSQQKETGTTLEATPAAIGEELR